MASRTYTGLDLRTFRVRQRLNQSQLGEMFATSQRVISSWESGRVPKNFADRFERVLVDYYAKHPELLEQPR